MDDDIMTDLGIMRNAHGTCLQDLETAIEENLVPNNHEIKSRCRFPHFYGRDGKYKNEYKVGYAFSELQNEDHIIIEKAAKKAREARRSHSLKKSVEMDSSSSRLSSELDEIF